MNDRVVIFGAGLAGLVTAERLAHAGMQVHMFERLPQLGGLARNVRMGGFTFDLGGHRFFSKDPKMIQWLQDLLQQDLLTVDRRSRIRIGDKFFHYPLQPANAILGFGPMGSVRIMWDYLAARAARALGRGTDDHFEGWVRSRFGKTLYEIYFKPYTEKTWNLPASEISADWASSRIQLLSLFDAVRRAVISRDDGPRTYAAQFFYPKGGIGRIASVLQERIENANGIIHQVRRVSRVRHEDKRVRAAVVQEPDGEVEAEGDTFVSTIPVCDLVLAMDPPPPTEVLDAARMLNYRSLVCVFMIIDREKVSDDTWIYFPSSDLVFGRSHEPRNWEREMSRPGMTSLCLEIFCGPHDRIWKRDDKAIADLTVKDFLKTGLVTRDQISTAFIERVRDAYPVFRVGYAEPLKIIRDYLASFKNLHLTGRTGTFSYLNMDQVVADALDLARDLTAERQA